MTVEEIVDEIRKQEKIINEAQKAKELLYQKLLDVGSEEFDYISVKEAARIVNVSVAFIYNKINIGKLTPKYFGSLIRVRKSEVLAIDDKYCP